MKKCYTYQEWLETKGLHGELGAKVYMSFELLTSINALKQHIGKILGDTFSKALVVNGNRLETAEIHLESDISLRAYEIVGLITTKQGEMPIEYLIMAYSAWREAQDALENWRQKPLWQYLKWWLSRKLHHNRVELDYG